ncbi:hypothetical protein OJE16_04380 [Pantoea tagorei]
MRLFKAGFDHLLAQRARNLAITAGNGVNHVVNHIIKVMLIKLLHGELRAAFIVNSERPFDVIAGIFSP